jgi:uncharacterized membrane protein (DUF2068 family)
MPEQRHPEEESAPEESVQVRPDLTPLDPGSEKANPLLKLPGLICIGLYMLALGAAVTYRVAVKQVHPIFLVLALFFVIASFGLMRLFRWAWAMTTAAVFLPMSYCCWLLAMKQIPTEVGVAEIFINIIIFMYLIRVEVRSKLR